jgi:hypothetical protein
VVLPLTEKREALGITAWPPASSPSVLPVHRSLSVCPRKELIPSSRLPVQQPPREAAVIGGPKTAARTLSLTAVRPAKRSSRTVRQSILGSPERVSCRVFSAPEWVRTCIPSTSRLRPPSVQIATLGPFLVRRHTDPNAHNRRSLCSQIADPQPGRAVPEIAVWRTPAFPCVGGTECCMHDRPMAG